MKARHWLEGKPLQCVRFNDTSAADMFLTACGATYISRGHQQNRYSNEPSRVTCKKCRKAYNFGQFELPKAKKVETQRLLPPV